MEGRIVGSLVGGGVVGDMVGGSSLPVETVGIIEVGRRDGIGVGRRDGIGVGRRDGIGVGRGVGLFVGSLEFLAPLKSPLSPFLAKTPVGRHAAWKMAKTAKAVFVKAVMVETLRWRKRRRVVVGERAQFDGRDRKWELW